MMIERETQWGNNIVINIINTRIPSKPSIDIKTQWGSNIAINASLLPSISIDKLIVKLITIIEKNMKIWDTTSKEMNSKYTWNIKINNENVISTSKEYDSIFNIDMNTLKLLYKQ